MAAGELSGDLNAVITVRTARSERVVDLLRGVADVVTILAAFVLSSALYVWLIRKGAILQQPPEFVPYATIALAFSLITIAIFIRRGLYRRSASVLNFAELRAAANGIIMAAALLFALLFFFKVQVFSRIVIVSAITLSVLLVILQRRLAAAVIGSLQLRGRLGRRVLICGGGRTGQLILKKIVHAPHIGFHVVGLLDDVAPVRSTIGCRTAQTGPLLFQVPVLGRVDDWPEVVDRYNIDDVLVVESAVLPSQAADLLRRTHGSRVRVGVVPHLEAVRPDQLQVDDLSAVPVLRLRRASVGPFYDVGKRLLDVCGAVMLAVLTAPLWIATAILVTLDSPGPILFAQQRVGRNGRPFRMFKFRTMWRDVSNSALSPRGDVDARITRVGRLLRVTGLDELPQLINVLGGSMSLVGPRPEMQFIADRYSELERQRLRVKPGITGLWQLSADRHAEIHENLEYDVYYIDHRSLALDALILLETAFFTLRQIGKALKHRSAEECRPAEVHQEAPDRTDEPYVLVALDQRSNGSTPIHWRPAVAALQALSDRWPVVVPVARANSAAFERLLADLTPHAASHAQLPRHVARPLSYHGRDELSALVDGAAIVITDLPHLIELATQKRLDLISIQSDGMRTSIDTRMGREVFEAFTRAFSFEETPDLADASTADAGAGSVGNDSPEALSGRMAGYHGTHHTTPISKELRV